MQIDIINGNFEESDLRANVSECINFYITYGTKTEGDKETRTLHCTPGLGTYCDLGTGKRIRDINKIRGVIYAVSDSKLFKVEKGGIVTQLQELDPLTDGNDPLYIIEAYENQIALISKNLGYSYNYVTNTLTEITDIDYPGLINGTTINGYLIGTNDTTRFYFSELNDVTNWQGDQTVSPNIKNDKVLRVEEFKENIYCFGEESLEVYRNTGSQAVFERIPGTSSLIGFTSKESVVKYNEGILFLGQIEDESPTIFLLSQYDPVPVAPKSITSQINSYSNLHLAKGYLEVSLDGQVFYYLSIPDANKTWVYNAMNQEWHIRQSRNPLKNISNDMEHGIFRGISPINFDGKIIYGDIYSSKLLYSDLDLMTEDGQTIDRKWVSKVFTQEGKNIFIGTFELDCNVGVGTLDPTSVGYDPHFMFRSSKDSGKTWSQERLIPLGKRGKYNHRPLITRLGGGKHWALEFKLSDPVKVSVISAYIRGSIGGQN